MPSNVHRWLHRLANVGIAAALLLAFVPAGMRAYGHYAQAVQRRQFQSGRNAAPPAPVRQARWGWVPALIQIPSIGVDATVEEVSTSWFIVPGPGHDPASVGPGSPGNCIIGAHRNMWDATFARLPHVKPGALVHLNTNSHRFTYRVVRSREVPEHETADLRDTRDATITLYTCMIPVREGRRWVVHGQLTKTERIP